MSLWEVYAEEARDFDQIVRQGVKKAKNILSIYPHDFEDELLYVAVRSLLRQNDIDAYTEVSESKWKEILNGKTLFNVILAFHLSVFDEQIFRQSNWLKKNDVFTDENNIELRRNLLSQLYEIRIKKFEGHTIEEAIRFKFGQVTELSDVLMKTDLESLKDHSTLNILEVISSILKYFCMSIFFSLYHDPVISNKCSMGNACSTLWSGKSLNTVHMEHLKAKSEQLEHVRKIVSDSLNIQQEEQIAVISIT
ncbi:hypothetical protein [Legionella sp. PC997]|uniref:hypothetical protein n=1 Tax=Legionella sp. PC997 TaxID=2755562 RepID=UPI0015FA2A8A|nr:hypothetical protein [Legionella sp. PC997]QMT59755.1 hypothetical protein HBNCFIEN_01122 [Legionella sp. PC997]